MGGKANGEKRRKTATLREAYDSISSRPYKAVGSMAQGIVDQYGDITLEEGIVLAMLVKSCEGDVSASTWIRDTIWGKPRQVIEQTGNVKNINIRWLEDLSDDELQAELKKYTE